MLCCPQPLEVLLPSLAQPSLSPREPDGTDAQLHAAHVRPTLKAHAFCLSLPYHSPRYRISNAYSIAPGETLIFLHVTTGQQWDIITASPGGAVALINSINARSACLPFDVALKQLQSLPVANPRAGVSDP